MTTMHSTPIPFGTQLIGQTENALGAILDRQLDGSGLSRRHWVPLTLAVMSGDVPDRAQLIGRVCAALNLAPEDVAVRIAELAAANMLTLSDDESVIVTDEGWNLHTRVRAAVGEITERLLADLSAADLEAAGRVLNTVLDRAYAQLDRP